MRKTFAIAAILAAAAGPAVADGVKARCLQGPDASISADAMRSRIDALGYDLQRLKIDDGCYEVHGKDAQGRAFKAKIDPQTLKVVKIKYKDRQRTGEREHAPQGARPAPGDSAAAPRDQIK